MHTTLPRHETKTTTIAIVSLSVLLKAVPFMLLTVDLDVVAS